MEQTRTSLREAMRGVINDSKRIQEEKFAQSSEKNIGHDTGSKVEMISAAPANDIQKALSSLKAPRPRNHLQLNNVIDLSCGVGDAFSKIDDSGKEQNKISARIHTPYKKFLENFKPLLTKMGARGLGGTIHQLISDYQLLKHEELCHLKEASDFLRQCRNAEKEYLSVIGKGNFEELDSKKKFSTSISTLKLVLDLKHLSSSKLERYLEAGFVSRDFVNEVHYYLNPEIYEKWEMRGY